MQQTLINATLSSVEFRFEDLVLHTEEVGKQLVEFINKGNSAPDQTSRFIKLINDTKKPEAIQKWKEKLNDKERYLCEAAAGETLRACGYGTEFDKPERLNPGQAAYYSVMDILHRVRNRLKRNFL